MEICEFALLSEFRDLANEFDVVTTNSQFFAPHKSHLILTTAFTNERTKDSAKRRAKSIGSSFAKLCGCLALFNGYGYRLPIRNHQIPHHYTKYFIWRSLLVGIAKLSLYSVCTINYGVWRQQKGIMIRQYNGFKNQLLYMWTSRYNYCR